MTVMNSELPRMALTIDDAAIVLGIRPRTVWRLIQAKKLHPVRVGGPRNTRLLVEDVRAYLASLRAEGTVA